ncbi:MAG: hypothetical protein M3367_15565 [Acidobacteriota bacterium]|nr:hypothetical protein [Acidobacteriota bacterium]
MNQKFILMFFVLFVLSLVTVSCSKSTEDNSVNSASSMANSAKSVADSANSMASSANSMAESARSIANSAISSGNLASSNANVASSNANVASSYSTGNTTVYDKDYKRTSPEYDPKAPLLPRGKGDIEPLYNEVQRLKKQHGMTDKEAVDKILRDAGEIP